MLFGCTGGGIGCCDIDYLPHNSVQQSVSAHLPHDGTGRARASRVEQRYNARSDSSASQQTSLPSR